jgi:nucleotide-binding universal stress UspA family protein
MPHVTRMLVPTDFTASSKAALDLAAELGARLGVPLIVIHAYGLPAYPLPEGVLLATPEQLAEMVATTSHDLHGELVRARALGAQAESELVEGDAYDVIVRIAQERDCDLIVMGTHGRRGLAHALLGSVAEKLVRQGPCPILAVRAK